MIYTKVLLIMFSKKKNQSKLDAENRELYEYARKRTLQKKRLFQHFVVFLIGSVFLIVLNVVIKFKEDFQPLGYNWFVWAVLLWALIFLIHFFNVFVINTFMGKEWQDRQMELLVKKQKEKIAKMKDKVNTEHPIPEAENSQPKKTDPETPRKPYNT
ncbi:2TM domain-containing protein [Autumnicola musiva]|uniref:2TM domain-containing protein n=1 Tax=Autumnicola musiva TaxID=3075589 RepID=A0ABU3D6G5_9FLAO|nr:2TM domain-containing protein [Zunongwangia sp. F117]MDT0677127.1 2TM domain-containing protein [Zunongwangia sp. F117]